ncbi:hypothetical protein FF38_12452 [Lucilia cuprina]|uniref:Uncharacterized protein n=1 Tax=Lucilia cuprina TaxID=7375 RepID=A0A0L0CIA5_LUCCU|nr:hypothetical protein FF38_12452 [Lucilia cuprina]
MGDLIDLVVELLVISLDSLVLLRAPSARDLLEVILVGNAISSSSAVSLRLRDLLLTVAVAVATLLTTAGIDTLFCSFPLPLVEAKLTRLMVFDLALPNFLRDLAFVIDAVDDLEILLLFDLAFVRLTFSFEVFCVVVLLLVVIFATRLFNVRRVVRLLAKSLGDDTISLAGKDFLLAGFFLTYNSLMGSLLPSSTAAGLDFKTNSVFLVARFALGKRNELPRDLLPLEGSKRIFKSLYKTLLFARGIGGDNVGGVVVGSFVLLLRLPQNVVLFY